MKKILLAGLIFVCGIFTLVPILSSAQVTPQDAPEGTGSSTQFSPSNYNGSANDWAWTPLPGSGSSGNTSSNNTPTTPATVSNPSSYCGSGFQGSINLNEKKNLGDLVKFVTCFISQLVVPLIFAIALLVFVWGMVRFMQAESSEEKAQGRQFMLWGIVALAVMVGVWGLVSIFNGTFGIKSVVPQIPVNPK